MKWYGKYGRKASQIVVGFGKYRRKLWQDMKNTKKIVKRLGKYGRKLWNVMEILEEK